MPIYTRKIRTMAVRNNTFDQLFPNAAIINITNDIEIVERRSRNIVSVYSRTAYIFVMSILVQQNRRTDAEAFYHLLRDAMFRSVSLFPDIQADFRWNRVRPQRTNRLAQFSFITTRIADRAAKQTKN